MSVSRLGRTFSKKNPFSCFAIDRFAQSLCKWITSYKADISVLIDFSMSALAIVRQLGSATRSTSGSPPCI